MFNIGGGELLVIAILALIVLGPDKLPQAARQAGRFMSEARKMSAGFRQELKSALDEADVAKLTADTTAGAATTPTPATSDDDVIEARARERGRRLTGAPEGAEPIGDQPVETEPIEPPAGPGTNGANGHRGNGNGSAPGPAAAGENASDTPDPS
jgi:sec-independent protein translocase protein TatB